MKPSSIVTQPFLSPADLANANVPFASDSHTEIQLETFSSPTVQDDARSYSIPVRTDAEASFRNRPVTHHAVPSPPLSPGYGNHGLYGPSLFDLRERADSSGLQRKPSLDDPLLLHTWKKTDAELKALKATRTGRKLSKFYKKQNAHIDHLLHNEDEDKDEDSRDYRLRIAINGSFAVNVVLFGLQAYAASSSGSLSLFATMADSFMDLLSSSILLVAERIAGKGNNDKYPTGASRMETAGIIVFSCLMATVSIQLIIESTKALFEQRQNVDVSILSASFVGIALFAKFLLFLYCYRLSEKSHTCQTLSQDHRNDLFVNGFGLLASLIGSKIAWWIDPAGAILIALIILRSWVTTAYECIQLIVGKSADPAFLQKITYLALTHHPMILQVDTCRAYHAGPHYYVEVDIVLDPDMRVRTAHDIAESLQIKIEKLSSVERAFVHIDYECTHKPGDEHKQK